MSDAAASKACPTVSVIITTRNRVTFLQEAIDSVLAARSSRYALELIVVNDGSTDGTSELLARYPMIKVIDTKGVGMAPARNIGLRAATGDFVTLLDDDDTWLPNNIVRHLELFERHPEYAAVHGQSQLVEFDGKPFGSPVPAGPLASGHVFEDLLSYMPQVATVLTRMSAAREAGDMDPTLTGDTDWDWLLRIAYRHPIGRFEEPVMNFRQRNTTQEDLAWRRFPATIRIFDQHVRKLPLSKRAKLSLVLLRHRGQWCSSFMGYARDRFAQGERRRALRNVYYALRASPLHTASICLRLATGRL